METSDELDVNVHMMGCLTGFSGEGPIAASMLSTAHVVKVTEDIGSTMTTHMMKCMHLNREG